MYLYQSKWQTCAGRVIRAIREVLPKDTDVEIKYEGHTNSGVGLTRLKVRWRVTEDTQKYVNISELPGSCGVLVAHDLPGKTYAEARDWIRTDIQAIDIVEAVARYTSFGSGRRQCTGRQQSP